MSEEIFKEEKIFTQYNVENNQLRKGQSEKLRKEESEKLRNENEQLKKIMQLKMLQLKN